MLEKPVIVAAPQMRLLVLDVDGTITNSRHEVSRATCDAVARVRAAGIRVVLATGRRYRDTLPVASRLGIEDPLITASGALIKRTSDHATLARAEFGPGVLEGVVAEIVAAGHEPVLYSDSFADGFDFHCRSLTVAPTPEGDAERGVLGLAEYLERNRDLACVAADLHRAVPSGVFAGFSMGPHHAMLALEESLHAGFPGQLSLHTIRSPRYLNWMCEIAPVGVTKWSGVMSLAQEWGIDAAEICAVGDDVNDLPMIRAAGLGIAMGNAQPEVLAAADQIVGRQDDDGLVDVADLLLRSGQLG
jgi:hydroxymethylpyrimidine pyrophosphatase-like HAD family hydrolase